MKLITFRFLTCMLLWGMVNQCAAQTTTSVIAGDFPDPTVIATSKGYYAAGTSSEWAPHYPVYHSTNLKDWKQVGYVFDKAPEWTAGSFWAPEYYHINKTYYIYYTARRKSDRVSCIGVATSNYPDHGFVDRGIIIDHGKEAIDPFVYNDNGQLYISFKAYGLDNRPIELLACKLSADGLKAEGEMFSLLKDDKGKGMEGQSILKHGKYYYLFYSAGGCCGIRCSYHIKVARATSFAGPYEKNESEELLKPAPGWKCSGHGTFVKNAAGQYYYLCHAYNERSETLTGREGMLSTLTWSKNNSWPAMKMVAISRPLPNIHDNFTTNKPAPYWQYDYHNSTPVVKQGNGKLSLSGTVSEKNNAGIIYGVRPVSDNFDMTTTVSDSNEAIKGLAFYGDANAALGVGTSGKQVKLWVVKDGRFNVIDSVALTSDTPVKLKLSMAPDRTCKAYYSVKDQDWKEMYAGKNIPVDALPQWDRAQRIGLFFKGKATESAQFSSFDIVNK
ncbi:family 43 glycosylhydrolase [Mucilaginibacter gossypiicola]|nr:family 43 glycosylhydrolase [Mucilaginibacter gossypiicola]